MHSKQFLEVSFMGECKLIFHEINCLKTPVSALVGEASTHARTIFRGKSFEFKLFFRGENIEQVNTIS